MRGDTEPTARALLAFDGESDVDEAIRGPIAATFERFGELGSARAVWLWLRSEGVQFPLRRFPREEVRWVTPTYHQVLGVLSNPVYAGAYVYGRRRVERYVDEHGVTRKRVRHLARADWEVLIEDHHVGYIEWATFEANQQRIAANAAPRPDHDGGGAVREGVALLQGLAVCARCGRKLKVHYDGRPGQQRPAYQCRGSMIAEGRSRWCLRVGGVQIDEAVAAAVLAALTPAA